MGLSTSKEEKIAKAILNGDNLNQLLLNEGIPTSDKISLTTQLISLLTTYIANHLDDISDEKIKNLKRCLESLIFSSRNYHNIYFLDVTQSLKLPQKLTLQHSLISMVVRNSCKNRTAILKSGPTIFFEKNAKELATRFNQLIQEINEQEDKETKFTCLKILIKIFTLPSFLNKGGQKKFIIGAILSQLDKESASQLLENIMSLALTNLPTVSELKELDELYVDSVFEILIPLNYYFNSKYKGQDAVEAVQKFHRALIASSTPQVLKYAKTLLEFVAQGIKEDMGFVVAEKTKALATQIGRRLEKLQANKETPQKSVPITLEAVAQETSAPAAGQASFMTPPAAQAAVSQAAVPRQYNVGAPQQYSTMELHEVFHPEQSIGQGKTKAEQLEVSRGTPSGFARQLSILYPPVPEGALQAQSQAQKKESQMLGLPFGK